jgi:hypothetical protein
MTVRGKDSRLGALVGLAFMCVYCASGGAVAHHYHRPIRTGTDEDRDP